MPFSEILSPVEEYIAFFKGLFWRRSHQNEVILDQFLDLQARSVLWSIYNGYIENAFAHFAH